MLLQIEILIASLRACMQVEAFMAVERRKAKIRLSHLGATLQNPTAPIAIQVCLAQGSMQTAATGAAAASVSVQAAVLEAPKGVSQACYLVLMASVAPQNGASDYDVASIAAQAAKRLLEAAKQAGCSVPCVLLDQCPAEDACGGGPGTPHARGSWDIAVAAYPCIETCIQDVAATLVRLRDEACKYLTALQV